MTLPDWRKLLRTARPRTGTTVLDRRHIYILPTRAGVLFGILLIGMLIGSINYSLSLGFVLTFLLGGLANVAMLHTWRNLAYLVIAPARSEPVFAGETAGFSVLLSDHSGRERFAVGMRGGKGDAVYADLTARGSANLRLPLPTERRGWFAPGRLTVFTEFPLGLFHAWSYVDLDHPLLVYPRPAPEAPLPPLGATADAGGTHHDSRGDDDFSGLRAYQHGDSPRRVDWKASAREQGLLTKQFQGAAHATLWLDWNLLPGRDAEHRISLLARQVLDAQQQGLTYGVRLPGREIPPGSGERHAMQCLEALALA